MCRALAGLKTNEAHIHQSDIKPDNWLISLGLRNGRKRIVLSDFGVAYVLNEGNVLFQGAKRGTARYLPPRLPRRFPSVMRALIFTLQHLSCFFGAREPIRSKMPMAALI
jgi:serine/threonine protein kinase